MADRPRRTDQRLRSRRRPMVVPTFGTAVGRSGFPSPVGSSSGAGDSTESWSNGPNRPLRRPFGGHYGRLAPIERVEARRPFDRPRRRRFGSRNGRQAPIVRSRPRSAAPGETTRGGRPRRTEGSRENYYHLVSSAHASPHPHAGPAWISSVAPVRPVRYGTTRADAGRSGDGRCRAPTRRIRGLQRPVR